MIFKIGDSLDGDRIVERFVLGMSLVIILISIKQINTKLLNSHKYLLAY